MRMIIALASLLLISSCAAPPYVATRPAETLTPTYTSRDGDAPAFHAALVRCGRPNDVRDRRLNDIAERDAAERAAAGDSGMIRVEVADADFGTHQRAFDKCMASSGFLAETE